MSLNLAAGVDFPSRLPTATAPFFLLGLNSAGHGSFARRPGGEPVSSARARRRSSMRGTRARMATSPSWTRLKGWSSSSHT
jgi:hypothetical protein